MSIKLGNDRDMSYTYRQSRDTIIRGNTLVTSEVDYLRFSSESLFTLQVDGRDIWYDHVNYVEYSVDRRTWYRWDGSEITSRLSDGLYWIYLRGIGNTSIMYRDHQGAYDIVTTFHLSGEDITLSGNIETLLDYKLVAKGEHPEMKGTLVNTDARSLLEFGCFEEMFMNSSGLTKLGSGLLPATKLFKRCYTDMFLNSDLVTIPANLLPATTLAVGCYSGMFSECEGLNTICRLPATEIFGGCYSHMFDTIILSTTQSEDYPNEYCIPSVVGTGTAEEGSMTDMFKDTNGNSFTPEVNITYYTNATV